MLTLALIHSPLTGPFVWVPVAEQLRQRRINTVVPALPEARTLRPPYWEEHANAVASALTTISAESALVLVGHSGGGMLLPAIRQVNSRPVVAYLFVDAGIPRDGMSRLDFFAPEEAAQFRAVAKGGLIPAWTEDNLRQAIPDAQVRRLFVQELRPLPLAVYEEPLPVFEGWPDAPCGYLQFSPSYEEPAQEARRAGWAYRELRAGHFHMLVDSQAVADALLQLLTLMGVIKSHGSATPDNTNLSNQKS